MVPDSIQTIINAVLYEGYMLYPYRKSALKNRHRWNFGVLFPEVYSAAHPGSETSAMQCECVLQGDERTAVTVGLRFLHLRTDGEAAVEREVAAPETALARLITGALTVPFAFAGDGNTDQSAATDAVPVRGELEIRAEQAAEGAFRVTVRVRNTSAYEAGDGRREHALPYALASTHILLRVASGEFISLTDPPKEHAEAAAACRNLGCWPVLVGEPGGRQWMLASPIILYDYPEIAPESPGDFFDGTEIDELLTLRVLTLTEEEKRELRRGDRRARDILERSETLSGDDLARLHGALRGMEKTK